MNFKDYEKNVERLKAILQELESGELSLDENMTKYKEGMKLYRELDLCLKESKGELVKIENGIVTQMTLEGDL